MNCVIVVALDTSWLPILRGGSDGSHATLRCCHKKGPSVGRTPGLKVRPASGGRRAGSGCTLSRRCPVPLTGRHEPIRAAALEHHHLYQPLTVVREAEALFVGRPVVVGLAG